MIYLDNSATTKPYREVIDSFKQVSERYFGNPSSIHQLGADVDNLQLKARQQIAQILSVDEQEVIFTSGGTEANNLAIKGVVLEHQNRGKHIITTEIEHASVYEAFKALEQLGFTVTYLPVNHEGVVDVHDLEAALTKETILVSVMHVNNEIGTVQPVEAIGKLLKKYPKVLFHVDAVQGFGKVPLNLRNSGIDLCSFSGHKINGLKGTGLLFVRRGVKLFPLFHGGNQEYGRRSGTENVAGNVALARAFRQTKEQYGSGVNHLEEIFEYLYDEFSVMDGVKVNSLLKHAPHIMNISVPGLKPEVIIHALYEQGVIISTQSACASKQFEESRVLKACGFDDERAGSGLRISLSFATTMNEIEKFLYIFRQTIRQLQEIME